MPLKPRQRDIPKIPGAVKFYKISAYVTGVMLLLLVFEMAFKYTPLQLEMQLGGEGGLPRARRLDHHRLQPVDRDPDRARLALRRLPLRRLPPLEPDALAVLAVHHHRARRRRAVPLLLRRAPHDQARPLREHAALRRRARPQHRREPPREQKPPRRPRAPSSSSISARSTRS